MKALKWMAWALAVLTLLAALPTAALADIYGNPDATDSYCPYDPTNTHRWSDWRTTSEATCTRGGTQYRECGLCDYRQTRTTSKKGHDYGGWKTTQEATCTKNGEQKRTCRVCGHVDTRKTDKAPHPYGEWTVVREATCTEEGSRTRTCTVCGHVDEDAIKMLPHDWGEWEIIVEATDHSSGTRAHTCRVCGAQETEDYDPEGTLRRGDKGDAVKALQAGLICYGALKGRADGDFGRGTEKAIKAVQEAEGFEPDGVAWPQTQAVLGHVFGEWEIVSRLSDFSAGIRQRTCERCGYVEREEEWPSPIYRRGDKGDGVKALQEALNGAGYKCGKADGDFGGKTERAVKALEKDHAIEPDGIAWPGVLKLLGQGDKWDLATGVVPAGFDFAFDAADGGPSMRIGGIKSARDGALSIEVTPGAISHTGSGGEERVVAQIVVANTGSEPVKLVEGLALNNGRSASSSDILHTKGQDGPLLEDAPVTLGPGESTVLWLNTTPGAADEFYGVFYRTVEVVAFAQDYDPPEEGALHKIEDAFDDYAVDTCVLLLQLNPMPGQKLRLTQGNYAMKGEGINTEITVELRAENLTDEPLTVSMAHFRSNGEEYDSHFVEWQGEGWGLFTLEPYEALDFGALLRPFPGEVQENILYRWLKAQSLDGSETYATLDITLPLGEYRMLAVEGATADDAPVSYDEDDLFQARLTAFNASKAALRSVRFLGEVLGPDGEFLHALDIAPDDSGINAYGTTGADLAYALTGEDAAKGELTFVVWAYAEILMGDNDAAMPVLSDNIWRCTVCTSGTPDPGEAPGDAVVSLSLSEGDRYYRPGEPIPLDITVTALGDHPLENLQVWLEPVEPGTDSFIYEDFGDLVIDTGAPGGGYVSLEPGKPWVRSHYDALSMPLVVAQRRPFDIMVYVDLYDPYTGEGFERTARVSVPTRIGTGALTFDATTDATSYQPGVPIEFALRAVNDDARNMEFLTFHARHAAPDEMDDSTIELVGVWSKEVIKPGGVREKTYTYVPTVEDAEKGALAFILSANVFYEGEVSPCAEIRRVIILKPIGEEGDDEADTSIRIDAAPKGGTFRVGEPLNIAMTITNTGNEPLRGVDINVNRYNAANVEATELYPLLGAGESLMPGESVDFPYAYTPDAKQGSHLHFIFTASGVGADSGEQTASSVDCYFDRDGAVETAGLLRVTGKPSWNNDGFIHYALKVENASEEPVTHIEIRISPLGASGEPNGTYTLNALSGSFTLEAGGGADAEWDYEPDKADIQNGVVRVRVTAAGVGTESGSVAEGATTVEFSVPDGQVSQHYEASEKAGDSSLQLSGEVQAAGYGEGDELTFMLELKNNGDQTVSQLSAEGWLIDENSDVDVALDVGNWADWPLEPSATLPFSWSYTISEDDVKRGFVRAINVVEGVEVESHKAAKAELDINVPLA